MRSTEPIRRKTFFDIAHGRDEPTLFQACSLERHANASILLARKLQVPNAVPFGFRLPILSSGVPITSLAHGLITRIHPDSKNKRYP